MEDNQLVQMIEYNREALARIVNVSVAEDGSTLCFGHQSQWRLVATVIGYFLAVVFLLFAIAGFTASWYLSLVCIVLLLFAIHMVRTQTRLITVDFKLKSVSIEGRLRKKQIFVWTAYRGNEIQYTVKRIPEQFYIKFQDGERVRSIKLTELSPLLRRYMPDNFQAVSAVWSNVEKALAQDDSKFKDI